MRNAIRLAGRQTMGLVAVCALSLGAIGCGGGGPKLVDVTGTIIDNGEPVDNAAVMFNPAVDSSGLPAEDTTGAQGTYKLTTNGRFGVAPGKYHVVVTKLPPPPDPTTPGIEQHKDDPFMAALSAAPPPSKKKKVDSSIEYVFDREVTGDSKQVLDFDLKSATVGKKQG